MIEVTREPHDYDTGECENCFHCQKPTRHWYLPKDVPCCPDCAKVLDEAMVPTKEEWIKRNPRPGPSS